MRKLAEKEHYLYIQDDQKDPARSPCELVYENDGAIYDMYKDKSFLLWDRARSEAID